jgi:hypothetical protein
MASPGSIPGITKKTESAHDTTFAEGGTTPMFGKGDRTVTATEDAAGEQTPGQTSSDSKNDPKYATGGSTKMFAYEPSVKATAGITGPR